MKKMFLNNKRTEVDSIKTSTTKNNVKRFFLFGSALLTITLAESAELYEKIRQRIEQEGVITKKRSLETANGHGTVNQISIDRIDHTKKTKPTYQQPSYRIPTIRENKVIYIDPPQYPTQYLHSQAATYQQYGHPITLARSTPNTSHSKETIKILKKLNKETLDITKTAMEISNPGTIQFNTAMLISKNALEISKSLVETPKSETKKITKAETDGSKIVNETLKDIHDALFCEETNSMSLEEIDRHFKYWEITPQNKLLMECAKQISTQMDKINLDAKKLGYIREQDSHISIQDAPFLKYLDLFPNIKNISLSNMNGLTDHALQPLVGLKNLTSVSINNCFNITDLSLANLMQNHNILSIEIMNCNKISPVFKGLFIGKELQRLRKEFTQNLKCEETNKSVLSAMFDIYKLTIDNMYQRTSIRLTKPLEPTALDITFRSTFNNPNYIETFKYFPLGVNFSTILKQKYGQNTLDKRKKLSQRKIENNVLLNLTVFFPNINAINFQGCNVTDEALWHLEKLPNLSYLDTRNSGISQEFQGEYRTKKEILALLENLNRNGHPNSRLNSYFTV